MQYIKLTIILNPAYQEIFIAELADTEFEGFQQDEDELITYILKEQLSLEGREKIDYLLAAYPGSNFIESEEIIDQQNWNRQWEKSIQPQAIGSFLVKPTWSDAKPEAGQLLLEIDPKMAFGTGYHPTTKLMLRRMPDVLTRGCRVLDAGTGSGILSIAAVKKGAQKVLAFDNDAQCIKSSRENIWLNGVQDRVEIRFGDDRVVEGENRFDLILINITLSVIKEMISVLTKYLEKQGTILLTGFLINNIDDIRNMLIANGLTEVRIFKEDEWILAEATK